MFGGHRIFVAEFDRRKMDLSPSKVARISISSKANVTYDKAWLYLDYEVAMALFHDKAYLQCNELLKQLLLNVDAIKPDTEPGLEQWLELNREYSEKWPNITSKKESPPEADEFRDEKLWGLRKRERIFYYCVKECQIVSNPRLEDRAVADFNIIGGIS